MFGHPWETTYLTTITTRMLWLKTGWLSMRGLATLCWWPTDQFQKQGSIPKPIIKENLSIDTTKFFQKFRWINHVHKNTIHGGPVHWIHENYRCPNCADYKTKYAEVAPLDESKTPFDRWQAWVSVEAGKLFRLFAFPIISNIYQIKNSLNEQMSTSDVALT